MPDNQTLSDYAAGEIRAILARRQLTGKELAQQIGVSRSWISYRLTGTTEIGLNDLQQIAAALEVDISALLPIARSQDIKIRSGRVTGRPRSTAKLHARHSTTRPTPTSDDRPMATVAAGATSAPRSRPSWRHA